MATKRAFGIALVLALCAGAAAGQAWKLKDVGVGLVTVDGEYDKVLKIAERGDEWDFKDLYEKGAFSGRSDGTKGFYAWLVGPPVDTYLNKNGLPAWNYKYKVTYPNGSVYESGTGGFYAPGFAAVALSAGGDPSGKWKIEWYIVHRDTAETRPVATKEFTVTWGKPPPSVADNWKLKDVGVGLITVDGEYDKVLKIAERGDRWDFKALYDKSAFSGRSDGTKGFYAWLVGPPVDTYLDKNGLPIWYYKYKVTYPDGSVYEGGPAGFYAPGFAAVSITPGAKAAGQWKIEWYLMHRDTKETRLVATKEFTSTW